MKKLEQCGQPYQENNKLLYLRQWLELVNIVIYYLYLTIGDVATYFEIMNNRGEQLQKHEILKARLMDALEPKYHDEFNLIWTACSTMDRPIQQCFNAEDRRKYFGNEYEEFVFRGLSDLQGKTANDECCTINRILDGSRSTPHRRSHRCK